MVSVTIYLQYPSQQKYFGLTVLKERNLTINKCGGQLNDLPPLKTMTKVEKNNIHWDEF